MQDLGGEKRTKMLGENDRESKLHDTSCTVLAGKTESKAKKAFQGPLKRQDETLKGLSENTCIYSNPRVTLRQHTSAYVSIRQDTPPDA